MSEKMYKLFIILNAAFEFSVTIALVLTILKFMNDTH